MNFTHNIFRKALVLCLLLGLSVSLFSFTAKALFPESFWRVVQVAERLSFLYGGVDDPTEFMLFENDGRVGIGAIPTNHSAILELQSPDKTLLVTRVNGVGAIADPANGMIVYDQNDLCFKVYQADNWSRCLGSATGIRVLPQEPNDGTIGDIYYNTTSNTLFVHDGSRYIAVTADFLELTAYHHNCTRHDLVAPNKQLRCPNNKQIKSLFYETATYSPTPDVHSIPEVTGIECCETAYHPFYWDASVWSQCSGGTQTRSVACLATNGGVVDMSSCIATHRPPTTQDCEEPVVPAQWETGEFGACSSDGIQTRTVTCVGADGAPAPNQCDAGSMPAASQSCVPTCTETSFEVIGSHRSGAAAGQSISFDSPVFPNEKQFQVEVFTEDLNYTIRFLDQSGNVIREESSHPGRDGSNDIDSFRVTHNAHQVTLTVTEGGVAPSHTFGYTVQSRTVCDGSGGILTASDNAQCDAGGKFDIPDSEFDALDGSANAFLRGENHAFIDWSRCDNQVTRASVDNGGIRINFRNPPRMGRVTLTVITGHANNYRVAHAANISGNLPGNYTSNRTYVYTCDYDGRNNYACLVTQ